MPFNHLRRKNIKWNISAPEIPYTVCSPIMIKTDLFYSDLSSFLFNVFKHAQSYRSILASRKTREQKILATILDELLHKICGAWHGYSEGRKKKKTMWEKEPVEGIKCSGHGPVYNQVLREDQKLKEIGGRRKTWITA